MAATSLSNSFSSVRARLPQGPLAIDLASSYALSVARVGSAAAIVALLYRSAGPAAVATFIFARSLLALINYAYAGMNPAVQTLLARRSSIQVAAAETAAPPGLPGDSSQAVTIDYASAPPVTAVELDLGVRRLITNAYMLAIFAAALIAAVAVGSIDPLFASGSSRHATAYIADFVALFVAGHLLRVIGEGPSGLAYARGSLRWDNASIILGELAWLILAVLSHLRGKFGLQEVGSAYALSGAIVAAGRVIVVALHVRQQPRGRADEESDVHTLVPLAVAAATLSLGSIADFLYGPSNVLIINRLLSPTLVADYGPALQIDGALLLTVSAVAVVMLPRVVEATKHANLVRVRRLYLRSTLASFAVLAAGALFVVALRDFLLRHWLGTVPPVTRMILPWVLTHTVIGGTAGVGRATLLGLGRFRAYTISALIGGVANVALALTFVHLGMGLRGIALATILAVAARCAIWMPLYILRATRDRIPTA